MTITSRSSCPPISYLERSVVRFDFRDVSGSPHTWNVRVDAWGKLLDDVDIDEPGHNPAKALISSGIAQSARDIEKMVAAYGTELSIETIVRHQIGIKLARILQDGAHREEIACLIAYLRGPGATMKGAVVSGSLGERIAEEFGIAIPEAIKFGRGFIPFVLLTDQKTTVTEISDVLRVRSQKVLSMHAVRDAEHDYIFRSSAAVLSESLPVYMHVFDNVVFATFGPTLFLQRLNNKWGEKLPGIIFAGGTFNPRVVFERDTLTGEQVERMTEMEVVSRHLVKISDAFTDRGIDYRLVLNKRALANELRRHGKDIDTVLGRIGPLVSLTGLYEYKYYISSIQFRLAFTFDNYGLNAPKVSYYPRSKLNPADTPTEYVPFLPERNVRLAYSGVGVATGIFNDLRDFLFRFGIEVDGDAEIEGFFFRNSGVDYARVRHLIYSGDDAELVPILSPALLSQIVQRMNYTDHDEACSLVREFLVSVDRQITEARFQAIYGDLRSFRMDDFGMGTRYNNGFYSLLDRTNPWVSYSKSVEEMDVRLTASLAGADSRIVSLLVDEDSALVRPVVVQGTSGEEIRFGITRGRTMSGLVETICADLTESMGGVVFNSLDVSNWDKFSGQIWDAPSPDREVVRRIWGQSASIKDFFSVVTNPSDLGRGEAEAVWRIMEVFRRRVRNRQFRALVTNPILGHNSDVLSSDDLSPRFFSISGRGADSGYWSIVNYDSAGLCSISGVIVLPSSDFYTGFSLPSGRPDPGVSYSDWRRSSLDILAHDEETKNGMIEVLSRIGDVETRVTSLIVDITGKTERRVIPLFNAFLEGEELVEFFIRREGTHEMFRKLEAGQMDLADFLEELNKGAYTQDFINPVPIKDTGVSEYRGWSYRSRNGRVADFFGPIVTFRKGDSDLRHLFNFLASGNHRRTNGHYLYFSERRFRSGEFREAIGDHYYHSGDHELDFLEYMFDKMTERVAPQIQLDILYAADVFLKKGVSDVTFHLVGEQSKVLDVYRRITPHEGGVPDDKYHELIAKEIVIDSYRIQVELTHQMKLGYAYRQKVASNLEGYMLRWQVNGGMSSPVDEATDFDYQFSYKRTTSPLMFDSIRGHYQEVKDQVSLFTPVDSSGNALKELPEDHRRLFFCIQDVLCRSFDLHTLSTRNMALTGWDRFLLSSVQNYVYRSANFVDDCSIQELVAVYSSHYDLRSDEIRAVLNIDPTAKPKLFTAYYLDYYGLPRSPIKLGRVEIPAPGVDLQQSDLKLIQIIRELTMSVGYSIEMKPHFANYFYSGVDMRKFRASDMFLGRHPIMRSFSVPQVLQVRIMYALEILQMVRSSSFIAEDDLAGNRELWRRYLHELAELKKSGVIASTKYRDSLGNYPILCQFLSVVERQEFSQHDLMLVDKYADLMGRKFLYPGYSVDTLSGALVFSGLMGFEEAEVTAEVVTQTIAHYALKRIFPLDSEFRWSLERDIRDLLGLLRSFQDADNFDLEHSMDLIGRILLTVATHY